jgi:geranylgeranylglycerol-phosphate geranylgeranyltransferase
MRPVNGVIAFAGVLATGFIAGAGSDVLPRLLLAGAGALFLGSAGNIANDVHDVDIDRINKPRRAIAAGTVSRRGGTIWAIACALAGIACSLPLGPEALGIAIASAVLMYFYSASFKGIPLLGNSTVGLLTGSAFVYAGYAAGNPQAGIVPGAFACLFNIAREILKDVEDMEGDAACGVRTFPLAYGTRTAYLLVSILLLALVGASVLPYVVGLYNVRYLVVVVAGVDIALLAAMTALWRQPSRQMVARVNTFLKYDMLIGIAAIIAGTK